ncbi:MAG TPA: hypothetical protein VHX43_19295 [Xanthobacteraceae bacterium]|jgi:hypothetical protein|nr:hypothetical protein [Xanthobacteraceae bacterium]
MVAGHRANRLGACRHLRRIAVTFVVALVLGTAISAPPAAAQRVAPALSSTDAILKWINSYRHKPDPESLPVVVHALSTMQAFKDAESSGPYIGFIAGVLGANPRRAENLIMKMLSIDPADHWVLVRAIAYSGLPNWKDVLATFVDRMPTRREMINQYLDGKLPTLQEIDFKPAKPGMLEKIKVDLRIGDKPKKIVALQPTPELIDVLWGYYLATGGTAPIDSVIKLLPLSNDHDNVDNLTTGSAAKFTLASNAVRDTDLLAMLQAAEKKQPDDIKPVLHDVIETAETVDTVHMRQESLAAIAELKEKGPSSKRELSGWGQVGQGALSMGCVVAAATGQIELGIPCVIGGAAYTAGLQYATH